MKITFIQTGGTIDKVYPSTEHTHGYNFEIGDPAFISIIQKINPSFEFDNMSVVKKDSLDFIDADRQIVFDAVVSCKNENIIITHGTDTIYKTAEKLSNIKNKKVILTGAMLPAEFSRSDAMFNIGLAVGAIQTLQSLGIYIALYGVVIPWDKYPDVLKLNQK
ncbi:MAG: asparaginase domain-containing protein [Patescibacteria group bacterium]